jgi:putative transposase
MARTKTIGIRDRLEALLPRRELARLAREHGLLRRERKVRVAGFFWALVLGFASGRGRSLAGLRRAHEETTGTRLAPSAFYDRFTPALVRMLKAVVAVLLAKVAAHKRALTGPLAAFRDLVITDATVIRLHALLERAFPACRTNHTKAALKLHTVMSAAGAGPRSIKVTSERVHDGPVFRVGPWVRDRLLLFDLAYFRFQLFSCITRNGGYFIVRLKKSANPTVVALNRRWRGRSVPILGQRVNDFIERLQRQALDAVVEVGFRRRVYGGVRHGATERFRLVGVRDPVTREHHLYLTNIPPEKLSPEDIAQVYAARWVVELFFRELKAHFRVEDMPSRKRHVVEALLYLALIAFVVSRRLLAIVRDKLRVDAHQAPEERWAILFARAARDILRIVLWPRRDAAPIARALDAFLLREAITPDVRRPLLLRRVESRIQFQHRISVAGHGR